MGAPDNITGGIGVPGTGLGIPGGGSAMASPTWSAPVPENE
jgi:hypothetical protein